MAEEARKNNAPPLTAKSLADMNQAFALEGSQESVTADIRCRSGGSPSNSSYYVDNVTATPLLSKFSLSPRVSHEFGDSHTRMADLTPTSSLPLMVGSPTSLSI